MGHRRCRKIREQFIEDSPSLSWVKVDVGVHGKLQQMLLRPSAGALVGGGLGWENKGLEFMVQGPPVQCEVLTRLQVVFLPRVRRLDPMCRMTRRIGRSGVSCH